MPVVGGTAPPSKPKRGGTSPARLLLILLAVLLVAWRLRVAVNQGATPTDANEAHASPEDILEEQEAAERTARTTAPKSTNAAASATAAASARGNSRTSRRSRSQARTTTAARTTTTTKAAAAREDSGADEDLDAEPDSEQEDAQARAEAKRKKMEQESDAGEGKAADEEQEEEEEEGGLLGGEEAAPKVDKQQEDEVASDGFDSESATLAEASEDDKEQAGEMIEDAEMEEANEVKGKATSGAKGDAASASSASAGNATEAAGRRWYDRYNRCHSGDSESAKFLLRVWAGMDATRIRFRVSGPLMKDGEAGEGRSKRPNPSVSRWPSSPLVMHMKQFLGFNRTLGRVVMRDWVQVPGTNMRMHFDPVLLGLLPTEDRFWKFSSCAVVGNAGSALRVPYGEEIDSKSAVFRINMAPTRGFERFVGTKTTFDIINQQHTKAFLPNIEAGGHLPTSKRSGLRNSILTVFEVDKEFARRHLYAPLLKRFSGNSRQHANVIVLAPEMVYHSHKVWKVMKALVEGASFHPRHYQGKPMSGFFAMMSAIQMCEEVHMYGFSPYRKGDSQKYHYFDATPGVTSSHSFDLGFEVFRQISIWPCSDVKVLVHS